MHDPGRDFYIAPLQHALAGWANYDPPTEKKLACHPDLPEWACEHGYEGRPSPLRQATGDLVCVAFYYLLRVGEYTAKTRRKKRKRTRQFWVKDVTFFVRCLLTGLMHPLPADATDEQILAADAATLRILNQKNGHKGACIHHYAIKDCQHLCPVRALGRRVIHISAHTKLEQALICLYWDVVGHGIVTDQQIQYAVKTAAGALKYERRGIPIDRVNTHSLRSGGACALKLAGYDEVEIRKVGRWAPRSNAFLEYIQNQLSSFSLGMAANMRQIDRFSNMEGATDDEDRRPSTIF